MGLDRYSLQMSFLSYFRTGYPVVDQLLVTFVVGIIMNVLGYLNPISLKTYIWSLWSNYKPKPPKLNSVEITTKYLSLVKSNAGNTNLSDEFYDNNGRMMGAIHFYLNQHVADLKESEISFNFKSGDYPFQTYRNISTGFRPLSEIKIGDFIFSLKIDQSLSNDASEKKSGDSVHNYHYITIMTIKSHLSTEQIHQFLLKIWNEYVDEKYPIDPNAKIETRWYFIRKGTYDNQYYIRYPLTSQVTFDDVIFPDKERLIHRIKQFQIGQTKLSRFSILLYGKPGGGKTSFIKALHNFTKNHVIVIKLSQFYNLDDLNKVFHQETLEIIDEAGGKYRTSIPINKRIYLFEDIDAEDTVVLNRNPKKKSDITTNSKTDTKTNSKTNSKIETKPNQAPTLQSILDKMTQTNGKTESDKGVQLTGDISETESAEIDSEMKSQISSILKYYHKKSKKSKSVKSYQHHYIKLADILNLLDGVLELNGCFVVMTTNHPEKLDPALIRAGRVTYKVELGELNYPDMKKMIHKFLPEFSNNSNDLDPISKEIDELLIRFPPMMPCKFEQLVQHEFDLVGVLKNLQEVVDSGNPESLQEGVSEKPESFKKVVASKVENCGSDSSDDSTESESGSNDDSTESESESSESESDTY